MGARFRDIESPCICQYFLLFRTVSDCCFSSCSGGQYDMQTCNDEDHYQPFRFIPRDAMRKRGLWCRPISVCLCLSVCHVVGLYPGGRSYHQTSFSARWNHYCSFFWPQAPLPNSKGNPFSRGAKHRGVGKFCHFDWNRR